VAVSGLVFAAGRPWPQLLKAVLDQLDPAPRDAELGLVFLADPVTEMADVMIEGLRERTGIRIWLGAASTAVFAGGQELAGDGAIAALPLALGGVTLHPFSGRLPTGAADAAGGIVHVPDTADAARAYAALARHAPCPLAGGQSASAFDHAQITMGPSAGAATGVLLAGDVRLVTGVSHGCRALGPVHRVTGGQGATLASLDGRPAAQVLAEAAGDLLLREPRLLARQILAVGVAATDGDARGGLPATGLAGLATLYGIGHADRLGGAVSLTGLPHGGSLPGHLAFYRRDPRLALDELDALARDLRRRLDGRPPKAALFYSSTERGAGFFGPETDEAVVLARALGPVPVIGMRSAAEVAGSGLTRYAAALALIA
jgi:small ligand-binding sensory domain FIST